MRVWDVHPGYLSRNSLLGQHGEIHALNKVIVDGKKGYSSHPETLRWQGHLLKLGTVHDLTVREMKLRGFRHHTPLNQDPEIEDKGQLGFVDPLPRQFELLRQKYLTAQTGGRIPLPLGSGDFWAQHKFSIMARGSECYQEVEAYLADKEDLPFNQGQELIHLVHGLMMRPVKEEALAAAAEQLWSSLMDSVEDEERETYKTWSQADLPGLISFLYTLAEKYKSQNLLESTIFADI